MPYMPPKPPIKKAAGAKASAYPPKSKPVSRAALPATPKRSSTPKKRLPKTM